ncbi:MAG: hypothetical protein A2Y56_08465 [Candidatus Aminicenantes bacterium RBG_13_63_10]|nr:MAG: hypothetical protein A2Y56_08465 [Candidatus Aminicenantes bacterium RBG_13_63_10]
MTHPRTRVALAGALLLALLVSSLSASTYQSSRLAMALGLNGSYNFSIPSDHGNGFGGGASLLIALSRNFALELCGQYSQRTTLGNMAAPQSSLSKGVLRQIPVQVLVQARLPIGSFPLVPYLTGGGGYALNFFSLDEDMVAAYQSFGFDISESIDGSPVWCVGAGVDIIPVSSLIINLHFLYRSSSAGGEWSISEELTGATVRGTLEGVNLNDMSLGLGLKFVF